MARRRMQSPDQDREVLLDTLDALVAERYVLGRLLLTIADALIATARLAASAAARMLHEAIESGEMIESDVSRQVEGLRRLVHWNA